MAVNGLADAHMHTDEQWMSRKVTIKELASKLGVSVPTLRKYGECGLLGVDSVSGRTNLFDESTAIARVEEINRLKSRGYSLALIREKLEERPAGYRPLDLGLEGPSFSTGRHALAVMQNMDEYADFVRRYVGHGVRARQGVLIIAQPEHRALYERLLREDGHQPEQLFKQRQLAFAGFPAGQRLDHLRQLHHYDAIVNSMLAAGWTPIRMLAHPEHDGVCFDDEGVQQYEDRLTQWVREYPLLMVCAWLAPKNAARDLLNSQRAHREFVFGDSAFLQP